MSSITLIGNLVKDPELRFMPNGQATATFTVADNSGYRDRQGNWQEKVSFVNVVAWRSLAENCAETLVKGDRVIVAGRLEQRTFEREDGTKSSVLQITADEVAPSIRWSNCVVTKNPRTDSGSGGRPAPAAAAEDYADEPF